MGASSDDGRTGRASPRAAARLGHSATIPCADFSSPEWQEAIRKSVEFGGAFMRRREYEAALIKAASFPARLQR